MGGGGGYNFGDAIKILVDILFNRFIVHLEFRSGCSKNYNN